MKLKKFFFNYSRRRLHLLGWLYIFSRSLNEDLGMKPTDFRVLALKPGVCHGAVGF